MIFALHTADGAITPPAVRQIQVCTAERLAELVVRLGLGNWMALRV